VLARWSEMRARFPDWEEKPPMSTPQELLGVPDQQVYFDFRMPDQLPRMRHWFVDEGKTRLLQVQDDCVVHNWRKTMGDPEYPRYEQIRNEFRAELETFEAFLQREDLGEVIPRQCEVTYVNHIPLDGRDVSDVLTAWGGDTTDGFLPAPEGLDVGCRYLMRSDGRPIGRLHVNARTIQASGRPHELRLTLTARGAPAAQTIDAALEWLDEGRQWVVRGFASITCSSMQHETWKRSS
jgi:uncharacterized protein (TIGR04255 family)